MDAIIDILRSNKPTVTTSTSKKRKTHAERVAARVLKAREDIEDSLYFLSPEGADDRRVLTTAAMAKKALSLEMKADEKSIIEGDD